jgi:hypothetical protein
MSTSLHLPIRLVSYGCRSPELSAPSCNIPDFSANQAPVPARLHHEHTTYISIQRTEAYNVQTEAYTAHNVHTYKAGRRKFWS